MDEAEKDARAARRAARAQHMLEIGPSPRNTGPKKETTDVDKVRKAKEKRDRRALRRIEEVVRVSEGRRGRQF